MTAKEPQASENPTGGSNVTEIKTNSYTDEQLQALLDEQAVKIRNDVSAEKGRELKAAQEEAERKRKEKELEEKGDFEAILKQRDAEIEKARQDAESLKAKVSKYEEIQKKELDTLLSTLDAENKTQIESLIEGLPLEKAKQIVQLQIPKKGVTTPQVTAQTSTDARAEWLKRQNT